jgi:cytochrome P450
VLPTTADLELDPHPWLARLREDEPVCWLPSLNAWLVTSHELAARVLRDARTFTVDDPRFTTARVTGPSMLSLDGAEHARHRAPFAHAFRPAALDGLAWFIHAETERLVAGIGRARSAEIRSAVAGPLAAAVMAEALGLTQATPATVLAWYSDIVAAVAGLAGAPDADPRTGRTAFGELAAALRASIRSGTRSSSLLADAAGYLADDEAVSDAAVLLFGGIETTEGMIVNAVLHLLSHPAQLALVRERPELLDAAVEESLRFEPAAAVVDRYATRDARLGGAAIRAGDPVTVSIAGANRDPAVFRDPGTFDILRPDAARHLAFAHGPHYCLGAHLARLETRTALAALLALPGLRLDPDRQDAPRGLVFRKPPALHVRWDERA